MADVTAPQFQQDVNNASEWANGDENTTVEMRLGQTARSPAKVIKDIENQANAAILAAANNFNLSPSGFDFATGGTLTSNNQTVVDASGNEWIYTLEIPEGGYTVSAGTTPTDPPYKQVTYTDHNNASNRNAVGAHDDIYDRKATVSQIVTESAPVGTRYKVLDRGESIFSIAIGVPNGYDKIDVGGGKVAELSSDIKYRSKSESWGISPETGVPVVNQTAVFNAFISDMKNKRYVADVQSGSYLVDKLDLKDSNVGGFKGAGMERTFFYASADLAGIFVDLGFEGDSSNPTDSSIQFAEFGGFTINANGFNIDWGLSFNFFRRSSIGEVKAVGFKKSFKYNYTWLTEINRMISENHTEVGHTFGASSINAITASGLVATSTVVGAKDYEFENPNSLVLVSPDSEGSGSGMHFSDGRSVTLLNSHHESATHKLRTDSSSTNGLCVNLIGGASFNAPAFFDMPDAIQSLTITNFTLYDIGADFSGVSWDINARNVVVNNLNVVTSNKVKATREQVKAWLIASIGSNVDFMSLDGETIIVNGSTPLVNQSDRFFRITATPSTPIDINTKQSMLRKSFTIKITQRLNSNDIASVLICGTVSDSGSLTQETISDINNSTANIVLSYNSGSERLAFDSASPIPTKIDLEYITA